MVDVEERPVWEDGDWNSQGLMGLLAVGMQRKASVPESLSHHLIASYQPAQWTIQGAGALFQCGSSVFPFGDQTFWHG